jgi:O-antigen/teichoic acid export membrane protein
LAQSGQQRLIPNYLVLVGAEVVARGVAFAAMLVVVHAFGPDDFGAVSLTLAIRGNALVVGECGLSLYATRQVGREPGILGVLALTVIAIRWLAAAPLYACLVVLALAINHSWEVSGLLPLFGLSLFTNAVLLNWVPQVLPNVRVLAAVSIGTQGLNLSLLLAGLWIAERLWIVPAAQVAAEGVVAAGLVLWTRRLLGRMGPVLPVAAWSRILRESAPMAGTRILRGGVTLGSDVLVLGCILSLEEVAWYSGAFKIYLLGLTLGLLYQVVLFPRLVHRAALSRTAVGREALTASAWILLGGLPALGLVALNAEAILRLVFGAGYVAATTSFQILLVALLVSVVGQVYRRTLVAQGRQDREFVLVALATGVHLALKFALVPSMGMAGAAVGTLAGETCLLVLVWRASQAG